MKQVPIKGEYITLGQLLKKEGIVSTGGEFRFFIENNPIHLNGETEQRRGKKIYPGDMVKIAGEQVYKVVKSV